MSTNNLRMAVIELSRQFEARYEQYWLKSNEIDDRDDLREKIEIWISEITKENISEAIIKKTTELTLKSIEFSKYPPVLNKFISLCHETNRMLGSNNESEIYITAKMLDESFEYCYNNLWSLQNKDKSMRRLNLWVRELKAENISAPDIKKTLQVIKRSPIYNQYPPTLNQFIIECRFTSINDQFIHPDIAFINCRCGEKDLHPVEISTKRRIGSHSLKISTDNHIKSLFEKIYLSECLKYLENPEDYILKNTLNTQTPHKVSATLEDKDFNKESNIKFFDTLTKNH